MGKQEWATATLLYDAVACMATGAPSASQRRSSGAQARANAAMSAMWNESDPPEDLVQSTPSAG